MQYIWLIPLLPGLGALVNGLVGIRAFSRKTAGAVACATMIASLGVSLVAFWQLLALPADARAYDVTVAEWIPRIPLQIRDGVAGGLEVPWGFRLDPLSGLMILVVTGIGTLIHIYSTAYMAEEPRGGVARFFCYLNLFCFFMLMLVLGNNYLVMFVGWEGVGLCSYLLIGYWYQKKSASDAGKKAFITNRVGDWGFILGMFLVFTTFGTLDLRAVQNAAGPMPVESAGFGVLSAICLLLFVGAVGKSAQIPLYVWLPDAMEGPTPVSALIHAATMVTAGVYMVGRNAVLFSHAPMVMTIVAVVGVLTALMAATIGLVQYDIKRVLAYSTVSQLGYMFTAMGVGAFAAGAFHLMTHAFFKALLFLGSGSVIHAMGGEQDMRRMGGLKKYLPVTYATMCIGTLAIAGVPPLAGFFSKDEILFRSFEANTGVWAIAVVTALMTAFYMFRLLSMTFFGAYRGPQWEAAGHDPHGHGGAATTPATPAVAHDAHAGHEDDHHGSRGPTPARGASVHAHSGAAAGAAWHGPHESPTAMTGPLMALAVGAIVAGFVGIPPALFGGNAIEHFLEPSFTVSAEPARPSTGSGRADVTGPPGAETAIAATAAVALAEGAPAAATTAEAATTGPAAATEVEGVRRVRLQPDGAAEEPEAEEAQTAVELGLMGFSVVIAAIGILLAWTLYVKSPELADQLAERFGSAHRVLSNKYYVDELYDATVISGTMASARGLWAVDRNVVDGAVNGTGWVTIISSWFSGLTDRTVVDGLVNLVGRVVETGSLIFRRLQTGLVQNYALVMLFGIFVFVSIYLFMR